MANTGRTLPKYLQIYQNGVDLTGETRSLPALGWNADFQADAALNWEIKGGYNGQESASWGQVNTIMRFDTTAANSPHDIITSWNQGVASIMAPIGIRGTAAAGDWVGMTLQWQKASGVVFDAGLLTATIDYEPANANAAGTLINFSIPWGTLLHAKGAETAANTGTGVDGGAAGTKGAWMLAQIFSVVGTGDVTIKTQDAAVNSNASFADVTGLTTGAIAHTAIPCAVWAQTATTATIRQYRRWQIALNGITSVAFALGIAIGR